MVPTAIPTTVDLTTFPQHVGVWIQELAKHPNQDGLVTIDSATKNAVELMLAVRKDQRDTYVHANAHAHARAHTHARMHTHTHTRARARAHSVASIFECAPVHCRKDNALTLCTCAHAFLFDDLF